jgi:hypothetical protein
MTRKSLGMARTTSATTELSASAAAEDEVSETSEAAADAAPRWPCPPEELRHSRLHLRPLPCFSAAVAGLSPTSVLIHFPDAPMDRFSAITELCRLE